MEAVWNVIWISCILCGLHQQLKSGCAFFFPPSSPVKGRITLDHPGRARFSAVLDSRVQWCELWLESVLGWCWGGGLPGLLCGTLRKIWNITLVNVFTFQMLLKDGENWGSWIRLKHLSYISTISWHHRLLHIESSFVFKWGTEVWIYYYYILINSNSEVLKVDMRTLYSDIFKYVLYDATNRSDIYAAKLHHFKKHSLQSSDKIKKC